MRTNQKTKMLLTALALLLVACSDPTEPSDNGRILRRIGSDSVSSTVNSTVNIGLILTNGSYKPIKGERIRWEIAEGRGEILSANTTTNGDGEAWTTVRLDTIAGPIKVKGQLETNPSVHVLFTVLATPGPAAQARAAADTAYVVVEHATAGIITFADRYGNIITDANVRWSFDKGRYIQARGDSLVGIQEGIVNVTAELDGVSASTNVQVVKWSMIAAGEVHTCGLLSNGHAYCWGANHYGQLGTQEAPDTCTVAPDPTPYPCATQPIPVMPGYRLASIWAGANRTCAITVDGDTYCWGNNSMGALGIGVYDTMNVSHPSPTRVATEERFQYIELDGLHGACALTINGTAYCWGYALMDTFGNGSPHEEGYSAVPVQVLGGPWKAIAKRSSTACALNLSGKLYCWGGTYYESVGNTAWYFGTEYTPTPQHEEYTFETITYAGATICGITTSGEIYCWEHNAHGELGLGYTDGTHTEPTQPVLGGHRFTDISAGGAYFCALDINGRAFCWGRFGSFLGATNIDNTVICGVERARCHPFPRAVDTQLTFTQITTGESHTCAISKKGGLYCWGMADLGTLGNGTTNSLTPTLVHSPIQYR